MMAVRGLLVGCAVFFLAGQVLADAKDDAKKNLIGKWETKQKFGEKEVSARLEFTKDGKLSMKFSGDGKDFSLKGTYKLIDENNFEMTITFMGKTMTDKAKYKVTKDKLEITGKDGKTQKFTRAK